jgi:hypothetical protein
MKLIVLISSLFFSLSSFALTCEVYESNQSVEKTHTITVEGTDDPHGSVVMLNLELLSDTFGGFAAVMGETIVISINHIPSGLATASHTPVGAKVAFHQMVQPGSHISKMQAVAVTCKTEIALEEEKAGK